MASYSTWSESESLASGRRRVGLADLSVEAANLLCGSGTSAQTNVGIGALTETPPGCVNLPRFAPPVPDVIGSTFGNESSQELTPLSSPYLRRRRSKLAVNAQERFWLLHKWHGQILAVDSEAFEAQLFDPSDPTLIERATFQKRELNPDDLTFLRPGATFYWFVGYRDLPTRQRKRESVIWMKRGRRLDQETYLRELEKVKGIWGSIEWATPKSATGA
jgi:hypothetical protein